MRQSEHYILAIDLGTGGPKVSLVGQRGDIAASQIESVDVQLLPKGGAEQNPAQIWNAIKTACKGVIGSSGLPAEAIIGVICCSQYVSIVPVDENGQPLMNMILWMDRRGNQHHVALHKEHPDALEIWSEIHGMPPLPGGTDSLAHMRWIKFDCPDIYARADKFLEPMDYVNLRFTGRPAATQCTAFPMLLTDNRTLNATDYDAELVRRSGIDAVKLPELIPVDGEVGTVLPEVASELGLLPSTKVFAGINDTQAGAVGTATFEGSHAGICVGTTSVMLADVDFKGTDSEHMIFSVPGAIPNHYTVMAENGLGGKVVEHFLENIVFPDDDFGNNSSDECFSALEKVVNSSPPGSKNLLFLPWLSGAFAPAEDENMRGGFLNMSLETTRADMARAVLEGVAFNFRWLLPAVESFTDKHFDYFMFSGGGAMSNTWPQILADILERPVHQMSDPRKVNTRGIGLLGFVHLGQLSLEELAKLCSVNQVFEPRVEYQARYNLLFDQFIQAYKQNQPIFAALNQ